MKKKTNFRRDTRFIKEGINTKDTFGFVNFPLYKGSTVLYKSIAEMEKSITDPLKSFLPSYGRFGSPTSRNFEATMTKLEGGYSSVCTSSGLSAIVTAIFSFVSCGGHILVCDAIYASTRNFCVSLRSFGIEVEYYPPEIGSGILEKIKDNTQLVYMESPGSNTFEIQDVEAISTICRLKKVATILDNTWSTPVYFNPIKIGVDIVIHSATKYIIGHSDGLLGIVVCADKESYSKVRKCAIRLGQSGSDENCYLALRGLKTIITRLEKHASSTKILSEWLSERAEVVKVYYPALKTHHNHDIWNRYYHGASGVFSIVLSIEIPKRSIDLMLNSLKIFGIGHGWGGFESLIVPAPHPSSYRTSGTFEDGSYLRINVGLEDIEDLISDLNSGFNKLKVTS